MIGPIDFVIEEAGCESCAARVRAALGDLLAIDEITVDEAADVAVVHAHAPTEVDLATVDAALADASRDSGHTYRVSPGSWRSGSESGQAGYA